MMAVKELNEIYKCSVCGNIIETVHVGGGILVCCGQEMALLKANTTDAAKEKHVPVKEKTAKGVLVKVGSVAHPMIPEHYIEWVQVLMDGWSCRRYLKPGEKPEAVFCCVTDKATAREYCNLHGLWKA